MKISIITATYNSGATLRDTINSVLSQNYTDWQHIIVDGGSKDNTVDIIKEMEPAYRGRLKWISEKDKGLYDAMNKGIAMADGDVIGILNSDDFYSSKNVLLSVAKYIKDVDAVYGDIHYVSPTNINNNIRTYSGEHFKQWKMRFGFMPPHPSFYCHKRIYEQYGGFDINYPKAADFENLFRFIYIHNISTKYVPLDFVTMRTGGETSSGFDSYKKSYIDRKNIFRKYGFHYNIIMASVMYMSKLKDMALAKLK